MEINKEPIALVGIGCRFPGGASSPKAYWNMLRRKKDAIVDVPKDRWDIRRFYDENPDKPGKMYVKQGGFLKEKIDRFDPLFFGISPREAESMDPQQRLLLEVTWEAFEDGGLVESDLRGSRTGVFVGGFCLDSMLMRFGQLNRELASSHSAASSTMTMLSNRISYTFDLKGPSVTMDTACSSSLVATHYACQSIWSGESVTAIVGGVNVMLRPEFPIVMSKGKFLSPHGRCKAFDEDAAGYARGEGAGVVILKPLSAALQHQDRIYGLIKETGVNQDGHTAGITLPSSDAQESLVRDVYRRGGVSPSTVDYVEAHGTGTQAGDTAEIYALNRVLREGRSEERKCWVGSVKTNIGHLEASAGVAGLIKAVLSLHHEKILPNLHFESPNPKIAFDESCIQIPTKIADWKRSSHPRFAGINSFGYGGTNAHVLLQEAPVRTNDRDAGLRPWNRPFLLPISARSDGALREIAGKHAFYLSLHSDPRSVADFFYTTIQRRVHHANRAAIGADSVDSLKVKLQQFSSGDIVENVSMDAADAKRASKLVFVFTGMGPQWWGMGRELMNVEPVFLEAIQECDALFREQAGWSILEELNAEESKSRMAKTEVAQPANFVIQVGLSALWKSWGIEPYAVIGHSVGEVASAYVSGALSLKDAITVSISRSQLQQSLAGQGAMVAAGLSEQRALEQIEPFAGVSIAAINSPDSVTLSGESDQVEKVARALEDQGHFVRRLDVEVGYHSAKMEPIKQQLLDALKEVAPRIARTPLYSTVVGNRIEGDEMTADYWWQNVRQPVRFLDGIQSILAQECTDFLEIGPHPVLGHSIKEIAADTAAPVRLTPSLNRKVPEHSRMLESLGQLYSQGQKVNWGAVCPSGGELVPLPTYPWQKERYWIESSESRQDRLGLEGHVFLNRRLATPLPTWSVEVNDQFFPYLNDHIVNGRVVFPGSGYVEAGLAIGREMLGGDSWILSDLKFHSMLTIASQNDQQISVSFDPASQRYFVYSRVSEEDVEWQLHASGNLRKADLEYPQSNRELPQLRARFVEEREIDELYEMLRGRGLEYGDRFRLARQLWTLDDEVLARIEKGNSSPKEDESILSPEVLDAAFHAILSIVEGDQPYVPVSVDSILFRKPPGDACWYHGVIYKREGDSIRANIYLLDEDGEICVELHDAYMRAVPRIKAHEESRFDQLFYSQLWEPTNVKSNQEIDDEIQYVLFSSESEFENELALGLGQVAKALIKIKAGANYNRIAKDDFEISPENSDDFERLVNELDKSRASCFIYLWSIDSKKSPDFGDMVRHCLSVACLSRAINKIMKSDCSITIVTERSQVVAQDDNVSGFNTSSLWGMGQVIENEFENIRCQLIDLDSSECAPSIDKWLEYFLYPLSRDIGFRGGIAYERSLKRLQIDEERSFSTKVHIGSGASVRLHVRNYLDEVRFRFEEDQRRDPMDFEVEIEVEKVYFNKEYGQCVFNASQFGNAKEESLVYELVGRVVNLGSCAGGLTKGDKVVSFAYGFPSSFSIQPCSHVAKFPKQLEKTKSFIFSDFVAAYWSVEEIARLRPGETVLILDAGSGIGFAIAQVAAGAGANVLATVLSLDEKAQLESIGVIDVEVAPNIDNLKSGKDKNERFNIIFNNSPNRDLETIALLLTPFGRYIDVGRRIKASSLTSKISSNLTYAMLDLGLLLEDSPELLQMAVDKIASELSERCYTSLPSEEFSASGVKAALERVAQQDTANWVSLNFEDENIDVVFSRPMGGDRRFNGTYLITGGNSGFGLSVARWLAEGGADRIVLVSRSGIKGDDALSIVESIQRLGARVESECVDVTDIEEMKSLGIRLGDDEGSDLKGVFHGAMVLDDCYINDLSSDSLRKVMAPKILGALNLYEIVKDLGIDFFVNFSSISSIIGNRGQANYNAANAFLDVFGQIVAQKGIVSKTINWGALSDAGIIARNRQLGQLLEKEGIVGLADAEALSALSTALDVESNQIGIFDVNWDVWSKTNPEAVKSTRFGNLLSLKSSREKEDKGALIGLEISDLEPVEQYEHIETLVKSGLSKVLKIPENRIDANQPLEKMGIDSLLLIELSLTIQSEFGINISAAELPNFPTVVALSKRIVDRLLNLHEPAHA